MRLPPCGEAGDGGFEALQPGGFEREGLILDLGICAGGGGVGYCCSCAEVVVAGFGDEGVGGGGGGGRVRGGGGDEDVRFAVHETACGAGFDCVGGGGVCGGWGGLESQNLSGRACLVEFVGVDVVVCILGAVDGQDVGNCLGGVSWGEIHC